MKNEVSWQRVSSVEGQKRSGRKRVRAVVLVLGGVRDFSPNLRWLGRWATSQKWIPGGAAGRGQGGGRVQKQPWKCHRKKYRPDVPAALAFALCTVVTLISDGRSAKLDVRAPAACHTAQLHQDNATASTSLFSQARIQSHDTLRSLYEHLPISEAEFPTKAPSNSCQPCPSHPSSLSRPVAASLT